jgi:hypothetical protein
MKKFLMLCLFVMMGIICSASFGQDCEVCRQPVRNTVSAVVQSSPVQIVSSVVDNGVRLVQNTTQNVVGNTMRISQNLRCRTQQTLRATRNRLRFGR